MIGCSIDLINDDEVWLITLQLGLQKTGIRGVQDTRQIIDGKTNDTEITRK